MDISETSQNLSQFLVNNYKQALKIIQGAPELECAMKEVNISNVAVFHDWLEEEKQYLLRLQKEPQEETHQIAYYEELI
ncbi:hypothetical protein AN958_07512 [Leucoagaricus sp. SymC.cos]|nr:hypothetical protein AN958_07512 [Leucoagaricus sp. SymC.cos]